MGNAQGIDQLNLTLSGILERLQNPKPAYTEIGVLFANEFIENFRVGGRPAWKPSKRSERVGRKMDRLGIPGSEFSRTLLKTGHLMKSVTVPTITESGIEFGSNLTYAAIHQFGGTIEMSPRRILFRETRNGQLRFLSKKGAEKRKAGSIRFARTGSYSITIDPRPYITFTDEMNQKAGRIIADYAMGQK